MNEKISRRGFVVLAAGTCAACAYGDAFAAPTTAPSGGGLAQIDAGAVTDYAKDAVYDAFAKDKKFFIVREGKKLFALSSRCTHKGTPVRFKSDKFLCPAHGSEFDLDGKPTKDPAKAALFRHGISITGGRVIVDATQRFGQNEWDKKGASVEVD